MKRRQSNNAQNSISNAVAIDAKPLRTLAPMFPSTNDINAFIVTNNTPFVYVNSSSLSMPSKRSSRSKLASQLFKPRSYNILEDDDSEDEEVIFPSIHTSASGRKIKQPTRLGGNPVVLPTIHTLASETRPELETDSGSAVVPVSAMVSGSLTDGKIWRNKKKIAKTRDNLAIVPLHRDPKEAVEAVLMTFDAIRRKLSQLDDNKIVKCSRPDLKAGATLMGSDLRANLVKRIGHVSGVEIGDMFYYRIELCLVGVHGQSMGGIDCMTNNFEDGNDTIAISVVLGGVYDNEDSNVDSLIYTGQGGDPKCDQKLQKGNLALERSLHRGNSVRVIRSTRDYSIANGKIYFYDGLYKVEMSWAEKGKAGFKVFKFKLVRQPDQPHGLAIWKMTQQWKEKPETRGNVILRDLSSGIENLHVCLVNEVDDEKGPRHFKYSNKVEYLLSVDSTKPLETCRCQGVCLPGDADCLCAKQNGGALPYTSSGSLVSRKPLIYECSASCCCSSNCRNRVTQNGIKLQFEVFKTKDRGWGLRSWDPIRVGTFICEYIGEVINKMNLDDESGEDGEYIFQTVGTDEKPFKWNHGPELIGEPSDEYPNESLVSLPVIINAKNMGNLSRFMNHSCSPNVFWQPVLYNHGDERYPHIMFFALKNIPPLTELTYDYGMSAGAGSRKTKECLCGSPKCRGLFG